MDVSALAAGGQRLLEALEASRTPPGANLVGNGPSPVPRELADAFARLLDAPQGVDAAVAVRADSAVPAQSAAEAPQALPADAEGVGAVSLDELVLSPEKLIALQFDLGKVVMQTRFALAADNGIIQNFESALKTQS